MQLYRWSKGEISSKETALNCGEHFVGGVASVAGIAAGGGIMVLSGCALPGVRIVLGFVLAVLFGLAARCTRLAAVCSPLLDAPQHVHTAACLAASGVLEN